MRKKSVKSVLAVVLATCLLAGCGAKVENKDNAKANTKEQVATTQEVSSTVEDAKTEEPSTVEEKTVTYKEDGIEWQQFLADMGIGWNLGNTLDCIDCTYKQNHMDYEAAWIPGDPKTTKEMILYVKEAGFNTIRIPVSWHNHVEFEQCEYGNTNFVIDEEWLARVKEVVDYCYDEGLYVIINIHHDDETPNFIYPTEEHKQQSIDYITDIWRQLATEFADYDTHLIYEVYNEVRLVKTDDEWDAKATNSQKAQLMMNEFAQAAVNTIRGIDKGYNESRFILVPGYAASLDSHDKFILPTDPGQYRNRIGVAVHAYTPYSFCMDTSENGKSVYNDGVMNSAKEVFRRIGKYYISNDIPAYIGEWGVILKADNAGEREKYAKYFGYASQTICKDSQGNVVRIPVTLWDNGYMGDPKQNEVYGYFNRSEVKWFDESAEFIKSLMEGYRESFE